MISPQAVQDAIKVVHYNHFAGTKTIVCLLVLTNGHAVMGQAHASQDVNFDLSIGMDLSRADAERHVYELLAFQQRNTQPAVGAKHE